MVTAVWHLETPFANYFMFRHVSGLTHWASVDCETGKVTESWGKEELIQELGRKNARKQDCCFRQSCQRTMAIQLLNWRANLRCSSAVLVSSFLQQWNIMNLSCWKTLIQILSFIDNPWQYPSTWWSVFYLFQLVLLVIQKFGGPVQVRVPLRVVMNWVWLEKSFNQVRQPLFERCVEFLSSKHPLGCSLGRLMEIFRELFRLNFGCLHYMLLFLCMILLPRDFMMKTPL